MLSSGSSGSRGSPWIGIFAAIYLSKHGVESHSERHTEGIVTAKSIVSVPSRSRAVFGEKVPATLRAAGFEYASRRLGLEFAGDIGKGMRIVVDCSRALCASAILMRKKISEKG